MANLSIGESQMRGCALARDLNVVQSRVKRQRPAGDNGWPADEGGAQPAPHVPLMQRTSAAASAAAAAVSSAGGVAASVRMATVSGGQGGVAVPGRIVGSGFCTTGGAIDQRVAATLTPNTQDSWR